MQFEYLNHEPYVTAGVCQKIDVEVMKVVPVYREMGELNL